MGELDLGHNDLDGDISEELSKCSNLEYLILDCNHIPESLSKLVHLKVLDLSSNNWYTLINAQIIQNGGVEL